MRFLKFLGVGIAIVVVLTVALLVIGIPGGLLTDVIQNRIERQTGYRLEIETTSIHLRPNPTIALTGISLTDVRNRENSIELTAASAKAQISLASLLRGKPHVDELIVTQPVLHAPMQRQRSRQRDDSSSGTPTKTPKTDALLGVSHVAIEDGTIVMSDQRRGVEHRLDKVHFDVTINADRSVKTTFDAVAGGKPIGLEANTAIPQDSLADVTIPVDFKLKMPAVLTEQISASARVKFDGSTILIDALKGDLDGAGFKGNASVELESKPRIKVNLDLTRIGIAKAAASDSGNTAAPSAPAAALQPWSTEPFDLRSLNYIDMQAHLSIGELNAGAIKIAPLEVDASFVDGILRGTASNIGIYEGQAAAGLAMDASADTPSFALRAELRQVRALPLFSSAANFDKLDGKLDATLNVQAVGNNQREFIASLSGVTVAKFQDGQIRGTDVAKMIRALTSGSLAGWQDGPSQSTDLTELSMSFQIQNGQAQTQDFKLAGPLVRVTGIGTVDMNTQAINFRLEPKVVMTIQGQGSNTDPVGFGVPVMAQGPWNQPRIFLDTAGILDNPDGAYAKLRQLGQGLFGSDFLRPNANSGTGSNPGGNNIMNNIGNMIQGLTGGPPNQNQPAGPGTAPAQGQAANPTGQGQTASPQGQGGAAGQQAGGPAPGQPATGGGLGQILGPQKNNPLNQIMQNLFGSPNQSNHPNQSK